MQANARIQQLLSALAFRGIGYRTLWGAKRPGSRYEDVTMLQFMDSAQQRVGILTAIIIDYGPQDGFGFFPESPMSTIQEDADLVRHGFNGMHFLMEDLRRFNQACDVPESNVPAIVPSQVELAVKLIREEANEETIPAIEAGDVVEAADGLADIIYVCVQAARKFGIPLAAVWREVQRSNMAKVDPATGKVRRREDGKILKPEGWKAPDVAGIIAAATPTGVAHEEA